MDRANLVILTAAAAIGMFLIPDAAFRNPIPPPTATWEGVPEAADTAEAYISARAELSRSYLHRSAPTEVTLRVRLAAPRAESHRPADVVVVLDRSGSMAGEDRIAYARQGLLQAARLLGEGDRLGIVTFSDGVETVRSLSILPETRRGPGGRPGLEKTVARITPDGSTYLSGGIEQAAGMLRGGYSPGRIRQILLLSDGIANRGLTGDALGSLGESLGQEGIVVTAMGVGSDYEARTFVKLADGSGGGYAYVSRSEAVPDAVRGELARGRSRLLDDLRIAIDLPPGVRFTRAYKVQARPSGQRVEILAPTLSSCEERTILVDLSVSPGAARRFLATRGDLRGIARVTISYTRPRSLEAGAPETLNLALSARATDDPRVVEASENLDLLAERETLRADLAWAESAVRLSTGDYDQAAADLRREAVRLEESNRRYRSPSVAERIGALLSAASRVERRSFWGGSAASEQTLGQGQAAISQTVY